MPAKDRTPGYAIQMQTIVGRAMPQTIIISTGCPNTATAQEIFNKIRVVNQALLATMDALNDAELTRQETERIKLEAQQAAEHAAGPAPEAEAIYAAPSPADADEANGVDPEAA